VNISTYIYIEIDIHIYMNAYIPMYIPVHIYRRTQVLTCIYSHPRATNKNCASIFRQSCGANSPVTKGTCTGSPCHVA